MVVGVLVGVLIGKLCNMPPLAPSFSAGRKVHSVLEHRQVTVLHGARVEAIRGWPEGEGEEESCSVSTDGLECGTMSVSLEGGAETRLHLRFGLALFASGAKPPPFCNSSCGLALSPRGYLLVDHTMRCQGCPSVFAAGDCISFPGALLDALPKAGVYAVRQAPYVARNIRSLLQTSPDAWSSWRAESLYHPQSSFLRLMYSGPGRAIGVYRGFSWTWWVPFWDHNYFRGEEACAL